MSINRNKSKVILEGFVIIPPSDFVIVKNELSRHIQLTRTEPGCLVFEVIQDSANPCRFNVYEEFVDKLAFQAHQTRVKSSYWGEITVNVERHYTVTIAE
ncbi:putative quinol monooxygenase [Aeromonas enteropelogenes]|uniref:putative quinol monooxygenase n=1 Tax=Aeromonas enteropelogenes TaxID=29489 RepID=UPI0009ECED8F|nr:antibiotic biosynthesis monooxygenase [Aeromonas enteropelogenes]UCA12721.1 antibiotic biosynthesis monooxygenase [Aeromonas enteropelogenes]